MCTMEESNHFEAIVTSSPLVTEEILGLFRGIDDDEEENENRGPEPTGGTPQGVDGEQREIGITPLTYNILLHQVQYQPRSKGKSLLEEIKVKCSPEHSEESNPGSVEEEEKPDGKKDRTCTKCNRTFLRRCDYNKHMNSHARQRKYRCPTCHKDFTRSNHVYRHMNVHNNEDDLFKKQQEMLKPLKKKSKKRKAKPAVEPERDSGLRESGADAGLKETGTEACADRGAGLKVPAVRDTAMKPVSGASSSKAVVPNGVRPLHPCNVCLKLFKHRKDLRQHLRSHPTHPCMCVICLKAFVSNEELSQHRRNHQQYRPHKCSICNKNFVRASHLKRHMGLHEKYRKLECSICGKQFTNSRNYQSHVDSHARNAAREAKRKAAKPRPRSSNANNARPLPPKDCLKVAMEVQEDFPDDGPLDLSKNSPMLQHYTRLSSDSQEPSLQDARVENHKLSLTLSPTKSLRMNGHVHSGSLTSWKKRDLSKQLKYPRNNHISSVHRDPEYPDRSPYLCLPCDRYFLDEVGLLKHAIAWHEEPTL